MNISEHKKIFGISAVIGLVVIFSAYLMNNAVANQLTTIEPTNQLAVYVPLSGPDLFPSTEPEIGTFLQKAFEWGIVIVLVLAVLYILMGGIEYMTSDAVFDKDDGKKKITAALAGLILALASWLILKTINPELLSTDPTRNADSIQRDTAPTTPTATDQSLVSPIDGQPWRAEYDISDVDENDVRVTETTIPAGTNIFISQTPLPAQTQPNQ